MIHRMLRHLAILSLVMLTLISIAKADTEFADPHRELLPGDRVLLGTVEEVRSDQARIDTGEVRLDLSP
jgi:hypothetical protein